jgi:hypothetical protein
MSDATRLFAEYVSRTQFNNLPEAAVRASRIPGSLAAMDHVHAFRCSPTMSSVGG